MSIWKQLAILYTIVFLTYVVMACSDTKLPDDPTTEPAATFVENVAPIMWTTPDYDAVETAAILRKFSVDPGGIVPKNLLDATLVYFYANQNLIANKNYVGIVDFSTHSSKPRFYIVGLHDGSVKTIHVAHGSGSDPGNTGYATKFSNVPESHMSSLGFYLTAELIQHNGNARKLDGLSSTNSNARARAIWLHSASYVVEKTIQPGRSWGCLAVATSVRDWTMSTLSQGTLINVGLSNSKVSLNNQPLPRYALGLYRLKALRLKQKPRA